MARLRLAVLDVDGTLKQAESPYQFLHRRLGVSALAAENRMLALSGQISYRRMAAPRCCPVGRAAGAQNAAPAGRKPVRARRARAPPRAQVVRRRRGAGQRGVHAQHRPDRAGIRRRLRPCQRTDRTGRRSDRRRDQPRAGGRQGSVRVRPGAAARRVARPRPLPLAIQASTSNYSSARACEWRSIPCRRSWPRSRTSFLRPTCSAQSIGSMARGHLASPRKHLIWTRLTGLRWLAGSSGSSASAFRLPPSATCDGPRNARAFLCVVLLAGTHFSAPFFAGLVLFAAGQAWGAGRAWETIAWAVLGLLFAWQVAVSLRGPRHATGGPGAKEENEHETTQ